MTDIDQKIIFFAIYSTQGNPTAFSWRDCFVTTAPRNDKKSSSPCPRVSASPCQTVFSVAFDDPRSWGRSECVRCKARGV